MKKKSERFWCKVFECVLREVVWQSPSSGLNEATIRKAAELADAATSEHRSRFHPAGVAAASPVVQPPSTIEGTCKTIAGIDEQSRTLNQQLAIAIQKRADGAKKVQWPCGGYQKYNAASSILRTHTGNSRLILTRVRPTQADLDVLPLDSFPFYEDMLSHVRTHFCKNSGGTFRWTMYTQGHMQQASDTFSMDQYEPAPTPQPVVDQVPMPMNQQPQIPPMQQVPANAMQYPPQGFDSPPIPMPDPPSFSLRVPWTAPSHQRPCSASRQVAPLPPPDPVPSPATDWEEDEQDEGPDELEHHTPYQAAVGWQFTNTASAALKMSMDSLRKLITTKAAEQRTRPCGQIMIGNGIIARKVRTRWSVYLPGQKRL